MDTTTTQILRILEQDARVSAADVATMVGVAEDEVRRVVRECEEQKIIRRYRTVVDWEKLGESEVVAFIDVRVSPAREVGFDDVASKIYRFPEVLSVHLVSGGYDLHVVVAGPSMKEVALFVAEKLATIDRVISTATHFMLRRYKEDGDILVEPDEDRRLAVTP
ncbi:MAG: Lrp [Armatimonadetes bacterium]|jgi:DNA-binding Lrp family transcriptional regulator|nr:Lrp [Armatimonadota bacterium]